MAKSSDTCSVTRRDGRPCQASTTPGGFVCRRHGNSAPQVQAVAKLRLLQAAVIDGTLAWQESRSFGDLRRISAAGSRMAGSDGAMSQSGPRCRCCAELAVGCVDGRAETKRGTIQPSTYA